MRQKFQISTKFYQINHYWIGILLIILLGAINLENTGAINPLSVERLYRCTNSIRAENSRNQLFLNEQLNRAASQKTQDMEEYKYWAHQNPTTGTRAWKFITEFGYSYKSAGENLAIGFEDSEAICEAWKKSPAHFANMLDPRFQEVGFAFEKVDLGNEKSGNLVVQLFATKMGFEKDLKAKPACSAKIDKNLFIVSPACGISDNKIKTLVVYNPRNKILEINIDGQKPPYKLTSKDKHDYYEFEQAFSLGSHEIAVKSATNKKAVVKFYVEDKQLLSDFIYSSILGSGSYKFFLILILISISSAAFITLNKRNFK